MAGETTVVHLPFSGGLDEHVAKEYLDASSRQASILNGDFVKAGVIDKRHGMAHLSTELVPGGELPELESGTRVVGWSRSALSVLCSTGLYQHVQTSVGGVEDGGVVGVGKLTNVVPLRRPITTAASPAAPTLCDLTYGGRPLRIAVFWDDEFNILASVTDIESGGTVLEPTVICEEGGDSPYVVSAFDLPGIADGNPRALVAIANAIDGEVRYTQYDPSANEFTALATMVASAANVIDVVPYEDDPANGWLVFYSVGGSGGTLGVYGPTLRLAYWTAAGQQTYVDQAIAGGGHALGPGAYVCGKYGQSVWTVWKTGLSGDSFYWAQRRAADHTLTTATSPFNFQSVTVDDSGEWAPTGTVHLGSDKIFVSYHFRAAGDGSTWGTLMSAFRVLRHNAGAISSWAFGRVPVGLIAVTRPFVVGGEVYQPYGYNLNYTYFSTDVTTQCKQMTLYLMKFEGISDSMSSAGTLSPDVCRPVATVAPRQASVGYQSILDLLLGQHRGLPSSVLRDTERVAVGLNTRGQGNDAITPGPSWACDFFFDEESQRELYQASELGSELSISGGVPFVADGQTAFEDGFFNYPEFTYAELEGTDTTLPSGNYTFAVHYRATDSAGLVHKSAPFITDPIEVTNGGPYPVLHITPPIASFRDAFATSTSIGKVYADIYMTTANGSTLYHYGSEVVSNVFTGLSFAPWPTVIDYEVGDEPDTTSPLLYTTGGILDHVNPPASRIQITHQKRKALVDETLRAVWFSKQFSEGEAPGFNEALYVPFPEGGDITALASLEGKFIAFKSRSIWIMEGQGPSPIGQGASWTTPEALSTDVGCKSWRSVVATPNGLMFQAPSNGIYMLGRDLQVTFIGQNVMDRTDAFPNVVSATLVPASTQVRFVCLNEDGDDHLVIIWDYLANAWTTHKYERISDVPASACLSLDTVPRYTVLTRDGALWQERLTSDEARHLDQDIDGEDYFVPTTITVPYVKTQVQGFHRMRRVQFFGEQVDDCGLRIQMAFNYDDTIKQTANWSPAQLRSLRVRGQVETYVGKAYNKQMSIQLTISDTEGTDMTSGAGMRFVATALELQNLGPRYKLLSAGARR